MRWCLGLAVSSLSSVALAQGVASEVERNVANDLLQVPGLTIVEEQAEPIPGYRFFVLSYTQPVDHLDPSRGSFEQRLTLLHRSTEAATVAFTTGYDLPIFPFRSEPTALVEGNQLGIQERFFVPSRPEPADFGDLNVYQAAADHHRIIEALRSIYSGKWLSTGGSKGGMASVFHRRFFDGDVDGSVIYVAPNDVVDDRDVYGEFLEQVGSAECRQSLRAAQRALLERRDEIVPVIATVAREAGVSFDQVGSADRAFELTAVELYWTFWQYFLEEDCALVPPAGAPLEDLLAFASDVVGLLTFSDALIEPYIPYFYQSGTELGYPDMDATVQPVADLLEYPGIDSPRTFVPAEIPMSFDRSVMEDVDRWVKHHGHELLFVYGENDPWGAEPYEPGPGTTDSYWYVVPGGNHNSDIVDLPPAEQLAAANAIRRWAALPLLEPLPPAPPASADAIARSVAITGTPVQRLARSTRLDQVELFATPPRL
jgi:hypothetical protein